MDPSDFEKIIAKYFEQQGFTIVMPPANTKGYDIELVKDRDCIAVQVRHHKQKSNIAQIEKFQNFLQLPLANKFTQGWFVSASGFSMPAITHVETERPSNLRLGTYNDIGLQWEYPASERTGNGPQETQRVVYIGVFTSKGGVGKTTIAAHLAGAFALMGHDVILVDLDPDKNLRKLFLQDPSDEHGDACLFVPSASNRHEGAVITVLNHDEFREEDNGDVRIVICDCSPVMDQNPESIVKKFDYCILPTTLSPLGIAKKADVIIRTFKDIRKFNSKAELFTVINGYDAASDAATQYRNKMLLGLLQKGFKDASFEKCKLIDPADAKIRYSNHLFYWGFHIVDGSRPQLAFREIAGRNYPRTDFLQLAEYLENHTDIEELRRKENDGTK